MERSYNTDYLPMEYEQTVQTLRNWDTLFFNTFSSIVVAGGIGGIVIAGKSDDFKYLPEVIIGVVTALYLVCIFYYLYNILIVSKKYIVLQQIEKSLGLVGAYKEHRDSIPQYIKYFLFPLLTFCYGIVVFVTWKFLK